MSPTKKSYKSKKKSNKTLFLAIGIIAIILIGVGAYVVLGQSNQPATVSPTPTPTPTSSATTAPISETDPLYIGGTQVLLQTTAGNITLELRNDKPITTTNFINLVKEGLYDNTIFHRVIAGFMIQGGQNASANVATIADEIGSNNRNVAYTIAMAKTSAPNSATSQFFINVVDNGNKVIDQAGTKFDAVYATFGKVISGQSVVDAIANTQVKPNIYGENSQPVQTITLVKATIIP